MSGFDIFGLITATITTGLLLLLLKLIRVMHEKMKVFNVVSHIRNKRLFVKAFENIEFSRLPNESEQEFWNKLPEGGLFNEFYKEEYRIVKGILQKKMKHKTIKEIEKLLSEYYPIIQKQKPK